METLIFGPFRLVPEAYSLTRWSDEGERRIALRPKAFDVLYHLLKHAGHIVSLDEFLSALWPETYVQPEVLKSHILAVRTALEDFDKKTKYIETVRGRGYRFIADVRTSHIAPFAEAERLPFLVGREAARAELELALRRASSGEVQLAFITGEAGIGKTALTETVTAAAGDAMVFFGRCLPGSGETDAYYPLHEILTAMIRSPLHDRLARALMEFAPAWLIQFPSLAPPRRAEVAAATPHRIARELCDAFKSLAHDRFIVLVLEDIHWADQATIDLIEVLANRRLRARLAIFATLRVPGPSEPGISAGALTQKLSLYRLAREIRLQRLSIDDVEAFVGHSVHPAPPPRLTQLLYRRSEGNPLFMRAILDVLLQHNVAKASDDGWHLHEQFDTISQQTPPDLLQIIEAEINALPSQAQAALEAGALAEGQFSPQIHHVAAGMDLQTFELICEDLARRAQLIRRGDLIDMRDGTRVQTYVFQHILFQEVARDRQGAAQRATRHAAIAHRLETIFVENLPATAPNLARHYFHAALWPQAIGALRMAARTAKGRFAMREAAAILEQGVAISHRLPDEDRKRVELELLDEQSRLYLGMFDHRAGEAIHRLSTLARELGLVEVEARALFGLGYLVGWTNTDRCIEIMREGLRRSADIASPLQQARVRCSAHSWLCWVQGWSIPDAEGFDASYRIVAEHQDVLAKAAADLDYTVLLLAGGRYAEAIDKNRRSLTVLIDHVDKAPVDLSLPVWMARLGIPWAQTLSGHLGDALAGFDTGAAAYEVDGDIGRSATLRLYQAFALERMCGYEAALSMVETAAAMVRAHGLEFGANELKIELVLRGLAHLGLGHAEEALAQLLAARAEMEARSSLTSWFWRLIGEAGLAECYLRIGVLGEAEICASALLERASAIEERTLRGFAAEICARVSLACDRVDMAKTYLIRAWSDIEGYDTALVRWRLHAIESHICELTGDRETQAYHDSALESERRQLFASLPNDHPCRENLQHARPFMRTASLSQKSAPRPMVRQ